MLNICIKGNKKFFKNFKKNPKALGILLLIWQPKYFDFHNPIILNMLYNKNLRLVMFKKMTKISLNPKIANGSHSQLLKRV